MSEEARNEVAVADDEAAEFSTADEDLLPDEGEVDLPDDDDSDEAEFDPRDDAEDHEIRAGGASRNGDDGNIYWLNLDQLREFNRMDRTIQDDTDFWAWFNAAMNKWGKRPIGRTKKNRGLGGNIGSWTGGWHASNEKKYLSDWWGGSSYFGGSSEKTRKLAIAVQAVQTTIRVVDSHERRMRVVLATEEETGRPSSYTAYDERLIQVSPMALLDGKVEEGEGIDITTGFALHEASHAEYSEQTLKAMRQPFLLRPISVISLLHNVLEDVRIEGPKGTGGAFPGFVGYFEKALDYMWEVSKGAVPATWGPDLASKMNAVIAACKWYPKMKAIATDPTLAAEVEWWHEWVENYRMEKTPLRAALVEALDHLKLDPDTEKELGELEADEKATEAASGMNAEKRTEDLKRLVKEMLKKHGLDKMPTCSSGDSPGGGVHDPTGKRKAGLGAKEQDDVTRLVRSEIEAGKIEDFHLPDLDGHNPKMTILRPPETETSRNAYEVANPSLVARMKRVFFFRPSSYEITERLMRTGSIDDDQLWRGGIGDYRMFEQRKVETTPDTSVTLLVDASGSMGGIIGTGKKRSNGYWFTKVDQAIELAQIMHGCLKDMNGVKVRVRAHTGDTTDAGGRGVALYRIWEPGEPITRLSLIHQPPEGAIQMGNNYDGYAIGWCIKELVEKSRPNEQMVLIVLSDGYPAGSGYQGEPAKRHMRETIAWGEKQGVDTIQVAIEGGMDQARMFKHFVMFESVENLPMQLTGLLRKIFPYR